MHFRYDFCDKIDYVKLKKRIIHHIKHNTEVEIDIYLPIFVITVVRHPTEGSDTITTGVQFSDIKRDSDKEIIGKTLIRPLMQELYGESDDCFIYYSANYELISNTILEVIKTVHKIDHLKAFL